MKNLVLVLVLICVVGCGSTYNTGKCIACNRQRASYSIGYCKKHYTEKKETKLRGIIKK